MNERTNDRRLPFKLLRKKEKHLLYSAAGEKELKKERESALTSTSISISTRPSFVVPSFLPSFLPLDIHK